MYSLLKDIIRSNAFEFQLKKERRWVSNIALRNVGKNEQKEIRIIAMLHCMVQE